MNDINQLVPEWIKLSVLAGVAPVFLWIMARGLMALLIEKLYLRDLEKNHPEQCL